MYVMGKIVTILSVHPCVCIRECVRAHMCMSACVCRPEATGECFHSFLSALFTEIRSLSCWTQCSPIWAVLPISLPLRSFLSAFQGLGLQVDYHAHLACVWVLGDWKPSPQRWRQSLSFICLDPLCFSRQIHFHLLGAHQFHWACCPLSPKALHSLLPRDWGCRHPPLRQLFLFNMDSGVLIQVLMLARNAAHNWDTAIAAAPYPVILKMYCEIT